MDWEITQGEGACRQCARSLEEGEEYFSAIYDRGATFERRDFCLTCWESTPKQDVFSFWKTRIPLKEEKPKKYVDDEIILDFFRKLENETEPSKRNFRYVLALFLMRRKVLKLKDIVRDQTGEALLLHSKAEDKDYKAYITELTDEQIVDVTEEVGKILNVQM